MWVKLHGCLQKTVFQKRKKVKKKKKKDTALQEGRHRVRSLETRASDRSYVDIKVSCHKTSSHWIKKAEKK